MITSYETGAVFKLIDEASPVLLKISAKVEELNKLIKSTQVSFEAVKLPPTVSAALERIETQLKAITDQSKIAGEAIAIGLGGGFDKTVETAQATVAAIDTKFKALGDMSKVAGEGVSTGLKLGFDGGVNASRIAADQMVTNLRGVGTAITADMAAITALSREAAVLTGAGGRGGGRGPGSGMGPRGARGDHSGGGKGGGFHYGGSEIFSMPGGRGRVSAHGDGMGQLIGGVIIADLLKHFLDASIEMGHWNAQMKMAGATAEQQNKAMKTAWDNAATHANTSAVEGAKMIIELNKVTGSWEESARLLDITSKASTIMQSVKAEDLKSKFHDGQQNLRFGMAVEEMGAMRKGKSPEENEAIATQYMAELMRTMVSTRGLVDGLSLYAMTNMSKGISQNWDMNMATVIAPLIGDMLRASKMGNADYMISKSYEGGGITSKATEAGVKWGLWNEEDTYTDSKGMHLSANSKSAEGLNKNLWTWSSERLEALKAKGIDINNQDTMNKMVTEVASNASTANMMRVLFEPQMRAQMEKEIINRNKVPEDAFSIASANDPFLKIDAFQKKWNDLLTAMGSPMLDPAMAAMSKMTDMLNSLAQFMHNNPAIAKVSGYFLDMAAAALVVGGAIRMLGWSFGGLGMMFGAGAATGGVAAAAGATEGILAGEAGAVAAGTTAGEAAGLSAGVLNPLTVLPALALLQMNVAPDLPSPILDDFSGLYGKPNQVLPEHPHSDKHFTPHPDYHPADDDRLTRAWSYPSDKIDTPPLSAAPSYDPLSSIRANQVPAFHPADDDRTTRAGRDGIADMIQQLDLTMSTLGGNAGADTIAKGTYTGVSKALGEFNGPNGIGGGGSIFSSGGGSASGIVGGAHNMRYGSGGRSGGGSGHGRSATGAESIRAKETYDFWRGKGLDHNAALGMTSQEGGESRWGDPSQWVGDHGNSIGAYQWDATRRAAILRGTGIDVVNDHDHQHQLQAAYFDAGRIPGFLQNINGKSLSDSVRYGISKFERSGNQAADQIIREHIAQGFDGGGKFAAAQAGENGVVNASLLAMEKRADAIMGVHTDIVSGFRSEAENRATGGAENSLHKKGWAVDLTAAGHPKSDKAFWEKYNGAMDQAGTEMGQPHRWGGMFGGRYTNDNNHFDLTQQGPLNKAVTEAPRAPKESTGRAHDRHLADAIAAVHAALARPHIIKMDGKKVGHAVMGQFASNGRTPRMIGGVDNHGHYSNAAGTPSQDTV